MPQKQRKDTQQAKPQSSVKAITPRKKLTTSGIMAPGRIEGKAYVYSAYPSEEIIRNTKTRDLPNRYLNEQDPLLPIRRAEHWQFQMTQNPFHALRAFANFHESHVYPPIEILDYLAKGIRTFLKAGGKKRLDDCLGLVGKRGRGHSYLATVKRKNRARDLCYTMFLLKKNFALSIEKCAELVSLLPGAMAEETLHSNYKKNPSWKQWRTWLEEAGDLFTITTLEGKQAFLEPTG